MGFSAGTVYFRSTVRAYQRKNILLILAKIWWLVFKPNVPCSWDLPACSETCAEKKCRCSEILGTSIAFCWAFSWKQISQLAVNICSCSPFMNYPVLFQCLVAELRQWIGTVMKHSRTVINSSTCRKSLNLELQTLVCSSNALPGARTLPLPPSLLGDLCHAALLFFPGRIQMNIGVNSQPEDSKDFYSNSRNTRNLWEVQPGNVTEVLPGQKFRRVRECDTAFCLALLGKWTGFS